MNIRAGATSTRPRRRRSKARWRSRRPQGRAPLRRDPKARNGRRAVRQRDRGNL